MKVTALPIPKSSQKKSVVPIFKKTLTKKAVFILSLLLLAFISYLSAGCTLLRYCSPFALALSCAMPASLMPAAVVGAAAGYLSAGFEIVPMRYLAALIIAVILKRLFPQKTASHPLFCGSVALISCALTGIAASVLLDEVEVTLLAYTAESFIAAAAAVFWTASVQYLSRMHSFERLKENELTCLLISVFLLILSLSYIKIYDISLAKILALVCVLLCAYYGKVGAASLAGIGAGTALGLGSEDLFTFAGLSVGGLLAGLGASHSKILSVLALEGGIAVPLLFGIGKDISYIPFLEAGIAAVIFLALPKKLLNRFRFVPVHASPLSSSGVQAHTVSRLRFASEALSDVSENVNEIGKRISTLTPNKKTAVYLNTMNHTCNKCGLKYYCWEREKEYTVSIFKKIEKMLENGVELNEENLPNQFGGVCIRSKTLMKNFTLEHTAYMANKLAEQQTASMRAVMSIQFDALAQLLFDLSEDIQSKEFPENELTEALEELLEYHEAEYLSAGVSSNTSFRLSVHLKLPYRIDYLESEDFLKEIEDICARRFSPASITAYEDCVKLSFFEPAALKTELAYSQLSAQNSRYCGDAVETIQEYSGKTAAVLADGMGKGLAAGINASLSAGILTKLLASGFSPASAIKIVNAALIVKDSDESFSSLDMVLIDLFNGNAEFYKAGATCSLIKHGNKIRRIELSSMPVGILDNADFAHSTLSVSEGDIVLLLSDGATQGESDWLSEMLLKNEYDTPARLAEEVCQQASKRQYGVHEDDISAVAIFIQKADDISLEKVKNKKETAHQK